MLILLPKQLGGGVRNPNLQRAAGFSLFELVVFIICVAIIYATAANRFAEFPGQAERANFLSVSTQLQSAINIEMLLGVGMRRISSPAMMEGVNPMDLLLDPPANYIGAFSRIDANGIERRVWYFDLTSEELVYLVNDTSGVFLLVNGVELPTDEIRFKIMADYGEFDKVSGLPIRVAERGGDSVPVENRVTKLEGIVLRPVTPYRWGGADIEANIAVAGSGFTD